MLKAIFFATFDVTQGINPSPPTKPPQLNSSSIRPQSSPPSPRLLHNRFPFLPLHSPPPFPSHLLPHNPPPNPLQQRSPNPHPLPPPHPLLPATHLLPHLPPQCLHLQLLPRPSRRRRIHLLHPRRPQTQHPLPRPRRAKPLPLPRWQQQQQQRWQPGHRQQDLRPV